MKKQLSFAMAIGLAFASYDASAATYADAVKLKQQGKIAQAESAFSDLLKTTPNNVLAIEQLAVVQSWQDKFDDAIANFKRALEIDADYTPARIGLARVSYWKGQRTLALKEMERVLQEQPAVAENWVLQGDILLADTKYGEARTAYLKAQSLGNNSDTLIRKIEHAVAPKRWRIDAGYISDQFSDVRADGHSSYAQIGYTFANHTTLYVRAEEYFSFDSTDTGFTVGAYYSPHKSVLLNGEYYSNTGDANFRPNEQFTLVADFLFDETWQPLLGVRQATYDVFGSTTGEEGDVTTITPGLRYVYDNHYAIEFRHARTDNIDDTTTSTNTVKLNMTFNDLAPYAFITDGEEGIPPLEVAEITIIGGGVVYKVNNSLSVRFDYSREDREDTYIYHAIGAGISYFF